MDDEKAKRKAEHAERLLKDPLLQEALEELKETCFYNIETSSHTAIEEREDLYYMLRCIKAFESRLKTYIKTGTVSMHNMNIKKVSQLKRGD